MEITEAMQEQYRQIQHCWQKIHWLQCGYLDSCFSGTGLSRSQHRIIMILSHRGGQMSPGDLAKEMRVSQSAITVSIRKLIQGNYVTQEKQTSDNRYHLITLSQKGRNLVQDSIRVFEENDHTTFEHFSAEELDLLYQLLTKAERNLSERKQSHE